MSSSSTNLETERFLKAHLNVYHPELGLKLGKLCQCAHYTLGNHLYTQNLLKLMICSKPTQTCEIKLNETIYLLIFHDNLLYYTLVFYNCIP